MWACNTSPLSFSQFIFALKNKGFVVWEYMNMGKEGLCLHVSSVTAIIEIIVLVETLMVAMATCSH